MSDLTQIARPVHRNIGITQIVRYRLPAAGIVSILHRASGALLFLSLPFLLYLFNRSLTSETSYAEFTAFVSGWFAKLVLCVLIWAYLHHLFAGLRHLVMDLNHGLEKHQARGSAIAVFAISLPLAAYLALKLFGIL